jgi:hypothetical protein
VLSQCPRWHSHQDQNGADQSLSHGYPRVENHLTIPPAQVAQLLIGARPALGAPRADEPKGILTTRVAVVPDVWILPVLCFFAEVQAALETHGSPIQESNLDVSSVLETLLDQS